VSRGTPDPALQKWEQRLIELTRQWEAVRVPAPPRAARLEQDTLETWNDRITRIRAHQLVLQRAGYWIHGRPDLLGVLGRERRETYHSKMLGWLLDPGAPTGLGTRFLRRFLVEIDSALSSISEERLESVSVQCEVARLASRADVVLFGDDFTVVVEVKVDAVEGPEQCLRLYRDFRNEPSPRYVFLTPRGEQPVTARKEAGGEFVSLSYRRVSALLDAVLEEEEATSSRMSGPPGSPMSLAHTVGRATCMSYAFALSQEFPL
jgi:hypothetical protein